MTDDEALAIGLGSLLFGLEVVVCEGDVGALHRWVECENDIVIGDCCGRLNLCNLEDIAKEVGTCIELLLDLSQLIIEVLELSGAAIHNSFVDVEFGGFALLGEGVILNQVASDVMRWLLQVVADLLKVILLEAIHDDMLRDLTISKLFELLLEAEVVAFNTFC